MYRYPHVREWAKSDRIGKVGMNPEIVLANEDRRRELIWERVPLQFGLLGDEHRKGNASLRARTRLDQRAGHGPGLGEGCVSETFGDGGSQKTVVLQRLISESEEAKEDQGADDSRPSSDLERVNEGRVLVQQNPGDLEDAGVSGMGVSPGDPWVNTGGDADDDGPNGNWNGEGEIDGGQSNETPIAAVSQVGIGADEILELLPPDHEGADGEGSVACRDNSEGKRPRPDENVSERGVPGGWETAKVLNDVEPMTSNDIFQKHLQHRNSYCYGQVDDHLAAFVSPSG